MSNGSSLYGSSLYQRCPKNPISTSGPGCPWSGGVVHPEENKKTIYRLSQIGTSC